jgi:DNA-binding transcriptional ArsR family regulator
VRNRPIPPKLLEAIAERFRSLSEPARLQILNSLCSGEKTVNGLVAATGLNQANLSKHLQHLHRAGFLARRKAGVHVYYSISDATVFQLCELMCGRLAAEIAEGQAAIEQLAAN